MVCILVTAVLVYQPGSRVNKSVVENTGLYRGDACTLHGTLLLLEVTYEDLRLINVRTRFILSLSVFLRVCHDQKRNFVPKCCSRLGAALLISCSLCGSLELSRIKYNTRVDVDFIDNIDCGLRMTYTVKTPVLILWRSNVSNRRATNVIGDAGTTGPVDVCGLRHSAFTYIWFIGL